MRVDGDLLFGPGIKFTELNWNNEELLLKAFKSRLKGWYLKPAHDSILSENAFCSRRVGGLLH
jgi:hypothetical protein